MRLTVSMLIIIVTAALTVGFSMSRGSPNPQKTGTGLDTWGKMSEGFQLSLRLDEEQVGVGDPIVLKLFIKNSSRKALTLLESSPDKDYKLTVRNEAGENVPLTEYGQRLIDSAEEYRRVTIIVKPGEERQDSIAVTQIYRITANGDYFITAERKVQKLNGTGWAKVISNTVKVRVTN